jgi:predicted permease
MRHLRRITARLRGVFRAAAIEKEINEEIESHLQLHIDDNLRRGMTEEEAQKEALLCLGDPATTKLLYREQALVPVIFRRIQDFLYSLSALKRSALFTATLLLALSAGIGTSTAIFNVLHNVLISPYPYVHPNAMYHLLVSGPGGELVWPLYTEQQLHEVRTSSVVDTAMGYRNRRFKYETDRGEAVATGTEMTSNAFSYLGVPVLYGRGLDASDILSENGPGPVVVVGYSLWKNAFHSNPNIVGTTLKLDQRPYTVIGVAAPHFTWGDGSFFVPIGLQDDPSQRYEINLRLRPGVNEDDARAILSLLLHDFAKERPDQFPHGFRLELTPLNVPFARHSRSVLQVLSWAAIALCFVVFANVCLLAASRTAARQPEFEQTQVARAGTRWLFSYLLTESGLIAFAGSLGGLLLALPLTPLLQSSFPAYTFPSEAPTHLGLVGCVICALFGLATFVLLGSVAAHSCFRRHSRSVTCPHPPAPLRRLPSAIITCQVALTVMLLFTSYVAMQAYLRVTHQPLGYQPTGVLVSDLAIDETNYATWQQRTTYFDHVLTMLHDTSKGTQFALSSYATPPNGGLKTVVTVPGPASQPQYIVSSHFVSSGYFSLLQVPVLAGSIWTSEDERSGAPVVVINDTMRHMLFGDGQALGRSVRLPRSSYLQYSLSGPSSEDWMRIVGVVADFRSDTLDRPIAPAIYLPFSMLMDRNTRILVRPAQDERNTLTNLQDNLHTLDPALPANVPFQRLDSILKNNPGWIRARLLAFASLGFAVGAFVIAGFSMYSNWHITRSVMSSVTITGESRAHFEAVPKSEIANAFWGTTIGLLGIWIFRSALQTGLIATGFSMVPLLLAALSSLILATFAYKAIRSRSLRSR